jgi:hypothetical protein
MASLTASAWQFANEINKPLLFDDDVTRSSVCYSMWFRLIFGIFGIPAVPLIARAACPANNIAVYVSVWSIATPKKIERVRNFRYSKNFY